MTTRVYVRCPGLTGPDGRCQRCGLAVHSSAGHSVEVVGLVPAPVGTQFAFVYEESVRSSCSRGRRD